MAYDHRVVLELVEGLQGNALLPQQALHLLLLQLLLCLLLIFLLLLLLLVLLLLGAQVVLRLLLRADLNGGQPAVHLVVGRVVQQHPVLGDPGPAFGELGVFAGEADAEDIAVHEYPAVVVDVFPLGLDVAGVGHAHPRVADVLLAALELREAADRHEADLDGPVHRYHLDLEVGSGVLPAVEVDC